MSGRGAGPAGAAEGSVAPRRWREVTGEVARDRAGQAVFAAVAVVAGLGYSVLLPFDYTQRISLANWQYFGPRYALFTVAFALGLAWVEPAGLPRHLLPARRRRPYHLHQLRPRLHHDPAPRPRRAARVTGRTWQTSR
jgi:hypothetical protein